MDYIKLLHLHDEPFSNSPDPVFFYRSNSYQACIQNLEVSIRLKRGLNLVLGNIGTGKTTLSRALFQQFQKELDKFTFQFILDPSFDNEHEFLFNLIKGFGLILPPIETLFAYKETIRQFLFQEGVGKGNTIILVIDEGQKLNDVNIELLRDFLNFETNQYKLIQIVILAQEEFQEKIKNKRNFTDRINTFYQLVPLSREETKEMIEFRLQRAGWMQNRELFSPKAIDLIHNYTKGYPRQIITLCHHSLLYLLIKNKGLVTPELVEYAIMKLYGDTDSAKRLRPSIIIDRIQEKRHSLFFADHRYSIAALGILLLLLLGTLLWGTDSMNRTQWAYRNYRGLFFQSNKECPGEAVIARELREEPLTPAISPDIQKVDMPVPAIGKEDVLPQLKQSPPAQIKKAPRHNTVKETQKWPVITMVVNEGDTVYQLARQVYNDQIVKYDMLKMIMQANPHIKDLARIRPGLTVYFPKPGALDREESK